MLKQPSELPTIARRIAAGELLLTGASDDMVMKELRLSKVTVRRYRKLVESGGLDALKLMGVGGRESALGADGYLQIAAVLQESARVYGFESDGWTNARVRLLIERKFGVRFSRVYVWQLVTNLGLGHVLTKSRR
ncbi:helix-turn-helix domain-containing protein [Caballeronia sordidicola]|jgi:transposase|uniref:helix-turn-helix domain-containing protein n=1 Tax=Caballeronia sordidicola TaxID=196367 RepID=UPI0004D00AC3|nr:helix-turn-helix domain-containing protein [Caballeronia sordidicola]